MVATRKPIGRVTMRKMLEVIYRAFPDAGNITISQLYRPRLGWIDCEDFTPLRHVIYCYETKCEAVRLRLIDRNGIVRHPDYWLDEFVDVFRWEINDHLEVNVNQGMRPAVVLAVVGDEALIEYEMPNGTTALWVVYAGHQHPACVRNVSYKSCPRKWLRAMDEAGVVWLNNPQ